MHQCASGVIRPYGTVRLQRPCAREPMLEPSNPGQYILNLRSPCAHGPVVEPPNPAVDNTKPVYHIQGNDRRRQTPQQGPPVKSSCCA